MAPPLATEPEADRVARECARYLAALHHAVAFGVGTVILALFGAIATHAERVQPSMRIASPALLVAAGLFAAATIVAAVIAREHHPATAHARILAAESPPPPPKDARFTADLWNEERKQWERVQVEDHGAALLLRRTAKLPVVEIGALFMLLHPELHRLLGLHDAISGASILAAFGYGAGRLVVLALPSRRRLRAALDFVEEAPLAAVDHATVEGREIVLHGKENADAVERLRMFPNTRAAFRSRLRDRLEFRDTPKEAPTLREPEPDAPRPHLRRVPRTLTPAESLRALDAAAEALRRADPGRRPGQA